MLNLVMVIVNGDGCAYFHIGMLMHFYFFIFRGDYGRSSRNI